MGVEDMKDCKSNFSFDMAQQLGCMQLLIHLHVLINQLVAYFLISLKCAILGVCCEAIPRQVGGTSITRHWM